MAADYRVGRQRPELGAISMSAGTCFAFRMRCRRERRQLKRTLEDLIERGIDAAIAAGAKPPFVNLTPWKL